MKILGIIERSKWHDDRGYLVEITGDEMRNLLGAWYSTSFADKDPRKELKPGDEVNIASMFRHLHALEASSKEIRAVCAKLRTAADLIETLPDPITQVKVEPDPIETAMPGGTA